MEWQVELAVVVLMLNKIVLGLASEFSIIIRRSSFLGETANEVRTEKSPLGVADPDPPDFLAPSLSSSPEAAAVADP
jgi:hypothetical protein